MKKNFYKTKFSFLCTPIDIVFCVCVFLVVKLDVELDVEFGRGLVRPPRLVSNAFLYTTKYVVIVNFYTFLNTSPTFLAACYAKNELEALELNFN